MRNMFEGTGVAIITPFNKDLSVDFVSLEKVIDHVISGKVDYIVALGTTGETATLTAEEKSEIIQFCKQKINERVPLVVGAGGNNTQDVINTIKELDIKGISGLLSVAPYYNKPGQEGLVQHFAAIADSTELPIIVYNVPGRTSSNISAASALKLATQHKNIVAVKEASGDFSQIMEIIKNKPAGFEVLSGDDALTLPMISVGAKGVISVVANSHAHEFTSLVSAALNGNFDIANNLQYKLLGYINGLFAEGSPSGIKAGLEIMGLCKNITRLPIVSVSNKHYEEIKRLIDSISSKR